MGKLCGFDRHLMRCIFCKQDSSTSRTIEHIIPESLGNKDHILPPSVVCDRCNNYFARKVEKPLLESEYFRQARFRNFVCNKIGNIPTIQSLMIPNLIPVEIMTDEEGKSIFPSKETDINRFIQSLKINKKGMLVFPVSERPEEHLMSRFLAKVSIEVLAFRLLSNPEGINETVNKHELDNLRNYARFGSPIKYWPFHMRRIYPEGHAFNEGRGGKYEVLHEFMLLYTEPSELYLIMAIFGIEYSLNMGRPEIDGYIEWLKRHSFKSPLYIDNNA